MPTVSPSRAKKLARTLLRENRKFRRSWRIIANDYGVNHATLNRIALHRGEWLPKDKTILIKLGLIKPRLPRPRQKTINEMTDRELIEYCQRRINKLNEAIHARGLTVSLGWIKEK